MFRLRHGEAELERGREVGDEESALGVADDEMGSSLLRTGASEVDLEGDRDGRRFVCG